MRHGIIIIIPYLLIICLPLIHLNVRVYIFFPQMNAYLYDEGVLLLFGYLWRLLHLTPGAPEQRLQWVLLHLQSREQTLNYNERQTCIL